MSGAKQRAEGFPGQLLVAGFEGTEPSPAVRELIREHRLGGVILYGKNCHNALQVLEMVNDLQAEARTAGAEAPLLIAIDQEQGRVVRIREGVTLFPSMGEMARTEDPDLIMKVAAAVTRELLAVGVNWNLAPVSDVLSAPSCAIGQRSFGTGPQQVGNMAAAYVRGAEAVGGLTCLKHFPGHGGTGEDSHVASPRVERAREELETVDLPPFRSGIAAGAPTVMTTHITFPALDPCLPATFSPAIVNGLLRGQLLFRGVVVTDDLEMAGSTSVMSLEEGALSALKAGVDLLLVSGMILPERDLTGLLESLAGALREGRLEPHIPGEALQRVKALKERYLTGGWLREKKEAASVLRCPEHLSLLDEVRGKIPRGEGLAEA